LAVNFFLLQANEALGIVDRLVYGDWQVKSGDKITQGWNLLLFLSLHQSGGFVALEALSRGLPVVCLDVGGRREVVTPNSGAIVKISGLNPAQAASRMATEIWDLLASPTRLGEMSAAAISRANEFNLSDRVAQFYQKALSFIKGAGLRGDPPSACLGTDLAAP